MTSSRLGSALRSQAPDLVLIAIAVVWGGSYLASKDLAGASTAAAVMCARFVPAAMLMLALCAARRGRGLRASLRPGLALGTLRTATIALETVGVTLTSAANAGLIIGLSVLFTPLIESVVRRRRISRSLLGSILLALIGVALLVGGNGITPPNLGDALLLTAAVTRAALGVAEAQTARRPGTDVIALTTIELTVGAVIFAAVGAGPLLSAAGGFGPAQWAVIAYLIGGCTIGAFLGQLWTTRRTSASRAGMLLATEPVWALGIAVVLAGERIGPVGLLGAAILIAATAWGRRAERAWRERHAVADPAEASDAARVHHDAPAAIPPDLG
ncbi:DMT family transporter [Schumannella luteola]|uniref:Drug/metabolite transporter (DMT)-like permease n=1 Tax=Schumannella luteola TaxID=472059 RepID=A0A852YCA1_9MICO|nr:DMT family transporter [Schumannella luteola]NYG98914.1 drug/metabolite transporter (DMT)-like permease [Schumannella luteola]TPX06292.1 DMT family transporter [Schumannella luteola]